MAVAGPRKRHERQLLSDLDRALRPRPRSSLPGVIWRWRYELALAAGVAAVMLALLRIVGVEGSVLTVSALAGALGPPWRRGLRAHAWRIITPHRLRAGFAQARIESREGRLPFIMRTTREPFGERALVWCPAGTSADDLLAARQVLRAACWAADVKVWRDERHAHLVTIDVIRK
jgi:hypothetical protein